jgi:transcriptional regulator with XRE-family HTH domain
MVFSAPPKEVTEHIQQLAERIRKARIRRGWSIAEAAEKAGVNRNTLGALEAGKPGVAMGTYIAVLWVLGLDRTLDGVADPDKDTHGKTLEASRRPHRVRKKLPKDQYDF